MEFFIWEIIIFIKRIPCYFGFHAPFSKFLFQEPGREHRECIRCGGIFTIKRR